MRKTFLSIAAIVTVCAPVVARADITQTVGGPAAALWNFLGSEPPSGAPESAQPTPLAPRQMATISLDNLPLPDADNVAAPPTPSVEMPLHRLFCVEYARAISGLNIFGDAKYWWERARNLYARAATPAQNAVMVFSGSRRLRHGHVAVVTGIVSPREIRVEQANWQNHGEIDHSTPVLDVSLRNDWSKVRVWDMASSSFGAHVYAISGFLTKGLLRQADNE